MRICLYSNYFLPRVGGIENASRVLADGWTRLGHQVEVVTDTPADGFDDGSLAFPVVRCPDRSRWNQVFEHSDILVSNGFSLRHVRLWRGSGMPFGWIHGMILGGNWDFKRAVKFQMRRWATHLGHFNICVSESMKRHIWNRRAVVIPNPIDPMFRPIPGVPATGSMLFYGRLWEPKGLAVLLSAVGITHRRGVDLPLDVVGEGEELEPSRRLVDELGIQSLVAFHSFRRGEELVRTINAAKLVVVPSVWEEPFGLTAAEAMACGKCVVGSRTGGLSEVLEGAGIQFPMRDPDALAQILMELEKCPERIRESGVKGLERVKEYETMRICGRYIDYFESVVKHRRR